VDAALQDSPIGDVGVTDTAAYTASTAKIVQIRAIDDVVGQDILARTSALLSSARQDLYLNVGLIVVVLLLAFAATTVIARSISRPLQVLRTSALDIAGVRLPAVIERLRDPAKAESEPEVRPIAIDSTDEIGAVARAFDEVHHAAVHLASEQALLRASVNAVFTNLSRRSQTLVERQLQLIDDLESGEREAGRLAQLFRLDHLATRMRRNNENLLVLAGEETARRWTEAVRLVDVARAAAAEVEHYERIILGEVPRVGIVGKAAPDVAHLVAELLENATAFSAPRTKVWIAARAAEDGGVVLRIEDAGIGMKAAELADANERISNPPVVDVSVARRMGLYVVGRLAARYGIEVRLGESQVGGVAALIHLPRALLTDTAGDLGAPQSQVDDEFYALSRQFDRAAQQDPLAAPPAALYGDTRTNGVALPMAAWQQETGIRPEPAPWYDQRHGAGAPEESVADTWFQPSEDREDEPEPEPSAEQAPAREEGLDLRSDPFRGYRGLAPAQPAEERQQIPQPRVADAFGAKLPQRAPAGAREPQQPQSPQRPAPQRHARPAPAAEQPAPVAAAPTEPTPIFEAIESEWFRRREQARAAAAGQRQNKAAEQDPSYLVDPAAAARPAAAPAPRPAETPATAQQAPAAAAPPAAPQQPRPEQQPAPAQQEQPAQQAPAPAANDWSSPADAGWRAAQALADPAHDGKTPAGLPKRTPRANLVPGRAGGTGAARAVPPPQFRHDPPGGQPS
jgi:hypothetical protein